MTAFQEEFYDIQQKSSLVDESDDVDWEDNQESSKKKDEV